MNRGNWINRMLDYFLDIKRRLSSFGNLKECNGFKGIKATKRNILIIITLVLVARLFFYAFLDNFARAEQAPVKSELREEVIDPMSKIKSLPQEIPAKNVCLEENKPEIKTPISQEEEMEKRKEKYQELLKGSPMENMIDAILEQNEETAAYLIAIAKKESGWGEHAPSKSGRDCFNYWGYKGSYNLVLGYSCFNSPEQAVDVVGGKINELIGKKINTPERMVVWKCGSSCAGHDPEGVRSWIGTVRKYWQQLVS